MRITLKEKETVPFSLLRCGDTFSFTPDSALKNIPDAVCMKGYNEGQKGSNPDADWENEMSTVIVLGTGEVFDIVQIDKPVIPVQGQFLAAE